MPMHSVRITQTTRVERSIVIEVEADTIEDAIEKQGKADAPALSDPRWTTDRDELQNEDVMAA